VTHSCTSVSIICLCYRTNGCWRKCSLRRTAFNRWQWWWCFGRAKVCHIVCN